MRVENTARANGPTPRSGVGRSTAGGFFVAEEPQAAHVASAQPAAATSGIDALLALQAVDDPLLGRKKAIRRGTALLDTLEQIKADVLIGQVSAQAQGEGAALPLPVARRLAAADAVLGVAAVLLLVIGLCRVFFFEKGAAYYFHSHAFLTKLTLFLLVSLVSVVPTMEFLAWRKALRAGQAPAVRPEKLRLIKRIIHAELAAVLVILLCAAIMARGGWV